LINRSAVAIDRAATLRNAEKLLRQGKVDAAIAEYVRVVEDHPRDWNSANVLGDLYVRAGKTDRAVEQFIRIADSLYEQGFLSKATALYKKILKLKPDLEHALLQAGEIAAQQGFNADARTHLGAVIERRIARGDSRGAAEVRVRVGSLDAGDFSARIAAASARLEINDVAGAVRDLGQIADELIEKERAAEAIPVLRQAAALVPDDQTIRDRLIELAFAMLEADLRSGNVDAGLAAAKQLIAEDSSRTGRLADLACGVAAHNADAAFAALEVGVAATVAQKDWPGAAALLQQFVSRAPGCVPALLRLVEICVDGALDDALDTTQAQLAEAYLAAGQPADARYIAEDLVTRRPSDQANIDRLRRSLERLGESDPDAVIAERLSAAAALAGGDLNDEAMTDADFTLPADEVITSTPAPAEAADAPASPPAVTSPEPTATEPEWPPIAPPPPPAERRSSPPSHPQPSPSPASGRPDVFELSANAVDIDSILGELESPPPPRKSAPTENVEVDLSVVLDDIKRPPPPVNRPAPVAPAKPAIEGSDIDGVFAQLRDEASRRSAIEAAEQEYRRGIALKAAGDIDGCIEALQAASRAPKLRFATASLLGRIFRERGLTAEAVTWYERAAQAPAPTAAEYHVLLFELAELLEAEGEIIRALTVCLELQAEAGDFRDVAVRVDRLAKVQARG
jgi:tetratricopeptide (TPR) repeat protein